MWLDFDQALEKCHATSEPNSRSLNHCTYGSISCGLLGWSLCSKKEHSRSCLSQKQEEGWQKMNAEKFQSADFLRNNHVPSKTWGKLQPPPSRTLTITYWVAKMKRMLTSRCSEPSTPISNSPCDQEKRDDGNFSQRTNIWRCHIFSIRGIYHRRISCSRTTSWTNKVGQTKPVGSQLQETMGFTFEEALKEVTHKTSF